MSVATVQQQLRASGSGERIEIGPYLSKLCDSLAKSMIGDRRPLAVEVQADRRRCGVERSGEHGADRHGARDQRGEARLSEGAKGKIVVSYDAKDSDWRLSVSDNGTGAQEKDGEPPHMGLGTSIVDALAHQLKASVQKTSGPQGTTVTIIASAVAAAQE